MYIWFELKAMDWFNAILRARSTSGVAFYWSICDLWFVSCWVRTSGSNIVKWMSVEYLWNHYTSWKWLQTYHMDSQREREREDYSFEDSGQFVSLCGELTFLGAWRWTFFVVIWNFFIIKIWFLITKNPWNQLVHGLKLGK